MLQKRPLVQGRVFCCRNNVYRISHGIPIILTIKTLNETTITSTSVIIEIKDILNEIAINFTGLTQVFYEAIRDKDNIVYELSVGGSCHDRLTPEDLGFTTTMTNNAWVIVFSTKLVMDDAKFLKRFSDLTQAAKDTHYTKRHAEIAQEEILINESPCRMYTQWVSKLLY